MDQTSPPVNPPHLPAATELLRSSWQYYKTHLSRLLKVALVPWIVIAVATIIAGLMGFIANKGPINSAVAIPSFSLALVLYFVVIIIAGCWQYVALIHAISPAGENKTWQAVYKSSTGWVWPYFLVAVITGVLTMIGLVLLVVPGIIIAVWFSLAAFIVVNENLSAIASLKASRNYVRGKFWEVLIRWIIFLIIAIGLSIIVGIIGGLFGQTVKSLLNLVLTLFLTPFIAIYGFKLYQAVKA